MNLLNQWWLNLPYDDAKCQPCLQYEDLSWNRLSSWDQEINIPQGFVFIFSEAFVSLKSRSYGYTANSNDDSPKLLVMVENWTCNSSPLFQTGILIFKNSVTEPEVLLTLSWDGKMISLTFDHNNNQSLLIQRKLWDWQERCSNPILGAQVPIFQRWDIFKILGDAVSPSKVVAMPALECGSFDA